MLGHVESVKDWDASATLPAATWACMPVYEMENRGLRSEWNAYFNDFERTRGNDGEGGSYGAATLLRQTSVVQSREL